jgi:hypothetical protein
MNKKTKFGELHQDDFAVGDIVEWSIWNEDAQEWSQNYGVITDIKNEIRSSRLVSISKVLPMSGGIEVEHFTMSLRLVSKSNKDLKIDS